MQEDPSQSPVASNEQSAQNQDVTPPQSLPQSSYVTEQENIGQQAEQSYQSPLAWTASEYILHEKTSSWYGVLTLVIVVIAAILYVITRDISVVCLIVVGGLVFGFYGSRKPRQIEYEINSKDLAIGDRRYEYREFKSFSVVPEGAFSSIILWPHKRFAQLTSIYYPPEHEEQIAQAIGSHLPFEEHNPDFIERLTRHLRF